MIRKGSNVTQNLRIACVFISKVLLPHKWEPLSPTVAFASTSWNDFFNPNIVTPHHLRSNDQEDEKNIGDYQGKEGLDTSWTERCTMPDHQRQEAAMIRQAKLARYSENARWFFDHHWGQTLDLAARNKV